MAEKILTISVAAYNVDKFLGETMESLIVDKKIMEQLDIIIVNDGSTDNTSKVANEYMIKYPDFVRVINKKNEGFGSTVNVGIDNARGKYFMLLDGDDWMATKNLNALIGCLEKNDADIIVAPFVNVYTESGARKIVDDHEYIPSEKTLIKDIDNFNEIQMHNVIIKTDLLSDNQIKVANCFYTDSELVLKSLLFAKTIMRFPRYVYVYRLEREGQSVSLDGTRKHYKAKIEVTDHMQRALIEKGKNFESYAMRKMLEEKVISITGGVYSAYMIQKNPIKFKKELIDYDTYLKKERNYIYQLSNKVKKVKLIRLLHFNFYKIVCMYVCHVAKKNEKY